MPLYVCAPTALRPVAQENFAPVVQNWRPRAAPKDMTQMLTGFASSARLPIAAPALRLSGRAVPFFSSRSFSSLHCLGRILLLALSLCDAPAAFSAPPALPPSVAPAAGTAPASPLATPGVSAEAAAVLEVVADKQVQVTHSNQATLAFGTVNALEQMYVQHDFLLRNISAKPVEIETLQPNCGCISTLLRASSAPQDAADTLPQHPALQPGQTVTLHMAVNLAVLPPGPQKKQVRVFVRGMSEPAAVLELAATLEPLVTFVPAFVNFGDVTVGKDATQTLTLEVDSRLAASAPPLVSSNPAIHAVLVPTLPSTPMSVASPAKAGSEAKTAHMLRFTYKLTVDSHAALGVLAGNLHFARPATPAATTPLRAATPQPQSAATGAATWMRASTFVVGQVVGDVQAQPFVLALGAISPEQPATRQVVLTGKSPTSLQGLHITCKDAWVTARLEEMPRSGSSASPARTRVMVVTLTPLTPAGVLLSEVAIHFANGDTMIIPVSAFLDAKTR